MSIAATFWSQINAQVRVAFSVGERLGLMIWERTGRRPAVIFFGAVGGLLAGLYVTCLVADWAWAALFPLDRRTELSSTAQFWIAAVPLAVRALLVFQFIAVGSMFWIWLERKVSARIQSRLGPMHTGGWHGWSQSLADGIKLIGKEDLCPAGADARLFRLAPYLTLIGAVLPMAALPFGFGPTTAVLDLDVGLFWVAAAASLEVIGILLAGWSANSKWSVFGGLRAGAQMIVYEVPLGLALLTAVVALGSLRLCEITAVQNGPAWNWLAFRDPFQFAAMFLFFLTGLAGAKRAPFDLPEAESELVGGYHTEYSGIRFVFFFMAEYAVMYVVSVVTALVWLGGPNLGLWWEGTARQPVPLVWLGPLVLLGKASALMLVQMWLRWTLPRLRLDQMMALCLKTLLPMGVVCMLGACLWRLILDVPVIGPTAASVAEAPRAHWQIAVDMATRAALMTLFFGTLAWLVREAVRSRRQSLTDEARFGPAWQTWGGRATSDRWAVGYDWTDPDHRKPASTAGGGADPGSGASASRPREPTRTSPA